MDRVDHINQLNFDIKILTLGLLCRIFWFYCLSSYFILRLMPLVVGIYGELSIIRLPPDSMVWLKSDTISEPFTLTVCHVKSL